MLALTGLTKGCLICVLGCSAGVGVCLYKISLFSQASEHFLSVLYKLGAGSNLRWQKCALNFIGPSDALGNFGFPKTGMSQLILEGKCPL